jgi:hypothetical protein
MNRSSNKVMSVMGVALILSGCQKVRDTVSTAPGVGVVALFDISLSTDQEALRQRYQKEFLEVVEKVVPMGVVIRADAIRAKPLAETTFPLRLDFAKMSAINRNEFDLEESLKKAKETTSTELSKLFSENPPTKQTPILDAIEVTRKIFSGADMDGIGDRRLVIFSDMIESSDRYEFTRAALGQKAIAAMIEKDKQAGRIPSLNGVKVWVAGAGAGGGSQLAEAQIRGIEQFWLAYFRAAGADLAPERYGSTLLNFSNDH